MSFYKRDEKGNIIQRPRVQIDCQAAIADGERVLTEQSHKDKVDINQIVKKNAGNMELITKTAALTQFVYDDVTTNNFQEMMDQMIRARDTFQNVPSAIRKQFGNDPAAFMDFVHNPDNNQQLIDWGLANAPAPEAQPVRVEVINTETPPPDSGGAV